MSEKGKTLVVGIGEVGGALAEVLDRTERVLRHDIRPRHFDGAIEVMHLCIPFDTPNRFERIAVSYIQRFRPRLTIINSTVTPGTTRSIAALSDSPVAFSPVRGKHARMADDLLRYTKFVAAPRAEDCRQAERHFARAGMKTRRVSHVETLELAKLAETTYFGVLIAFAQELDRYARKVGGDYEQIQDFFEEVSFLPRWRYFPGFIGGHCVIPNIHLLREVMPSTLLEAVLDSNRRRAEELEMKNGGPCESVDRSNRSDQTDLLVHRRG